MALNVRDDLPVDQVTVEILGIIKAAALALGMPVTLVGATARDIILTHVHNFAIRRATADIDIAIAVHGWDRFEALFASLLMDGRFQRPTEAPNRLWFHATAGSQGRPVDIVPYGPGMEGAHFTWPRDRDTEMNVTGYADAAACAEPVHIAEQLDFNVLSLPGLALLKIHAWIDRRAFTKKDADDLSYLFGNYVDAGNFDRLYEEETELLGAVDYNLERAAPYLLGRDVSRICSDEIRRDLGVRLGDIDLMDKLALDLAQLTRWDHQALDKARRHISDFTSGVASFP